MHVVTVTFFAYVSTMNTFPDRPTQQKSRLFGWLSKLGILYCEI